MSENKCTAWYVRETQIFWEFVHVDGEKEYKCMISKIKEISLEFTDDMEKAHVPAVLRSIAKKTSQHLKESISVWHHVQTRFDQYLPVDEGWDDSTEELVTDLFKLAGDASSTLAEMHYRIAILQPKVRPETFLKLINAIPLSNTNLTVIQRAEPELGLNVDEERIWDHMPRPAKLDGTDIDTKLLGTLVHWVMHNNLLTRLNTYSAKQASKDFDVLYTKLKRVITGVWQHGGSYYERLHWEQEGGEAKKSSKKHKAVNPVNAALAKKRKVTLSVDTAECKYCGKLYHSGKKLTEHINKKHAGEQTIYACPYCTQPFNQYWEYLKHLGEHKDKVIRCRLCNKEFKTITKLRRHTKSHVNQCSLCSMNFLTPQALQDHVKESHGSDPATVERQCSLCKFTCNSMSELAEHSQNVHHPYSCRICNTTGGPWIKGIQGAGR